MGERRQRGLGHWMLGVLLATGLQACSSRTYSGQELKNAELRGRDLRGADFRGATLERSDLRNADLRNASMVAAQLVDSDLSGARLEGADLTAVRFRDVVLDGTDLSNAQVVLLEEIHIASARGARLGTLDLRSIRLDRSTLAGSDMRGIRMSDASCHSCDLRGADLRDADLRYVDLRHADLRDADLRDADLRGANLAQCDLGGARLQGARLGHADLRACSHTEATRWPEGFMPSQRGVATAQTGRKACLPGGLRVVKSYTGMPCPVGEMLPIGEHLLVAGGRCIGLVERTDDTLRVLTKAQTKDGIYSVKTAGRHVVVVSGHESVMHNQRQARGRVEVFELADGHTALTPVGALELEEPGLAKGYWKGRLVLTTAHASYPLDIRAPDKPSLGEPLLRHNQPPRPLDAGGHVYLQPQQRYLQEYPPLVQIDLSLDPPGVTLHDPHELPLAPQKDLLHARVFDVFVGDLRIPFDLRQPGRLRRFAAMAWEGGPPVAYRGRLYSGQLQGLRSYDLKTGRWDRGASWNSDLCSAIPQELGMCGKGEQDAERYFSNMEWRTGPMLVHRDQLLAAVSNADARLLVVLQPCEP